MSKRGPRAIVQMPRGVHHVVSRGRDFYYFQSGRGTAHAGERIRLPDDPHSPVFWVAVRQAQGLVGPVPTETINALCDAYMISWPKLHRKLSEGTQEQYTRSLRTVRKAWGDLRADALRPSHVQALMDALAKTPGKANNVLDALRAMCRWAVGPRELLERDPTIGVPHFADGEGHKPWTPEQLACADAHFTGPLRRGYMLARYTGQRISDVVRLGFTDIDDGGLSRPQKKTGVQPWCPIFPELETEMAGWEKRPGPFLIQCTGRGAGKPFTTNQFWKVFDAARKGLPALEGAVWHGLRANAVISLRQAGHSALRISDMVGMSTSVVERYCRHADRKAGGQAVLLELKERTPHKTVKP